MATKQAANDSEKTSRRLEASRYMMATKAIHKLGDISREIPALCAVHGEDGQNYIGNWVIGSGFFNVKFPKGTTRELTEQEKDEYHGMQVKMGDGVAYPVITKACVIPTGAIKVVTRNSVYHLGQENEKMVRSISRDGEPFGITECIISFLAVGKSMQFYSADAYGTTSEVLSIEAE